MANIEKLVAENRLGRIIALLGSDKDGEVLAAVAALKRTLKASGGDLHDLVALLEGKVKVVHMNGGGAPLSWREKVAACMKEQNFLNEWEKSFLANIATWNKPTEKQHAVLNKIYTSLYT